MDITASCPSCSAQFTFDASQIGQAGSCPTCQAQITLAAPSKQPPTTPKPTASARLARRDYLNRLRAESSYSAARRLAGFVFGLISIIGGLATVLALVGMLKDGAAGAVGVASGLATIGLAIAAWQACVVVFDIADVLIDGRK